MATHIAVIALLCAATCQPTEFHIWDGDSFRLGKEAVRIANIDAPEIDGKCAYELDLAVGAEKRLGSPPDGRRRAHPTLGSGQIRSHAGDRLRERL